MMANNEKLTFVMYKVMGGIKHFNWQLSAISEQHAIVVAEDFYKRCGLIGRYYIELSNGKAFSINQ
jgi:hypothetical protein